jgi:hypothetical protein
MKNGIIIYMICLPLLVTSQVISYKAGIIDDPDGYTLIRQSQTVNSPINDTIFKGELFYFTPNDSSNWYQVRKFEHKIYKTDSIDLTKLYKKWDLPAYVHKSRIIDLENLNKTSQAFLIDSIFNIPKIGIKSENDTVEKLFENKSMSLVEIYHPILNLFVNYMCNYNDEKILDSYFELLMLLSGSPDEAIRVALGYVYECKPEMIIEKIREIDDDNLINELEFGFIGATYGREDEINNYNKLKNEIEKLTTTNYH